MVKGYALKSQVSASPLLISGSLAYLQIPDFAISHSRCSAFCLLILSYYFSIHLSLALLPWYVGKLISTATLNIGYGELVTSDVTNPREEAVDACSLT
jgi:hypothetical protein